MESLPILRLATAEGNVEFLLSRKEFFFGGIRCSSTGASPLPLVSGRI